MIIGFIGGRSGGKTLSQTLEAYKKSRKEGYTIYSNYHLKFPYIPYTVDELLEWAEEGKQFNSCLILIDEMHIYFDSRTSGRKRNRIFSYLLNQSSKTDVDVYYSSQFSRQIDIRTRLNTEIEVQCKSKSLIYETKDSTPYWKFNFRPKPKVNYYKILTWVRQTIIEYQSDSSERVYYKTIFANPYFKLYDTREVIKQQKDKYEIEKSLQKSKNKTTKLSYKELRNEQHQNRLFHEMNEKRLADG